MGKESLFQRNRVQKKSRLQGSEPEEDFAFYVIFEEGLVICINNPDSAKFSVHRASTVKGITLLQLKFPRHTMQSSKTSASFDFVKRDRSMMKI